MRDVWITAAFLATLLPVNAAAHGIWGHVHVTGWAVENMADDELRQFLLDDPEVFNALLFGAVFTDTGYSRDEAASRAYSEHAHWEPFIQDYIDWIRLNDPPPWTSGASKKRVAFLMGCASHGLQDSIFDSLFLHQVEAHDGASQSATDPGTDGFLALDGHIRFIPEEDIPMSTMLELFATLPEDITREIIEDSVGLVTAAYVNEEIGVPIAAALGEKYEAEMPWGRLHYMDPAVPGSLRAEIYPTMRYQQAIWARLHGDFSADDAAIFAYPEIPRRLRSGEADTVDSWATLIFGAGVRYEGGLVELLDDTRTAVAFTQANTRWGASDTRLIRLQPQQDLVPGGWYTARLRAGIELVDAQTSEKTYEMSFQVACAEGDPACPDVGEIAVASIEGLLDEPAETEAAAVDASACHCGSAQAGGAGWFLVLAVAGYRRRSGGRVGRSWNQRQ